MTLVEALARVRALEQELDLRDSDIKRQRSENQVLRIEIRLLQSEASELRTEIAELRQLLNETRSALEFHNSLIEELERRVNQSSRNSSKPPSSDGPGVERPRQRGRPKKDERAQGGQPGHAGKGSPLRAHSRVRGGEREGIEAIVGPGKAKHE